MGRLEYIDHSLDIEMHLLLQCSLYFAAVASALPTLPKWRPLLLWFAPTH